MIVSVNFNSYWIATGWSWCCEFRSCSYSSRSDFRSGSFRSCCGFSNSCRLLCSFSNCGRLLCSFSSCGGLLCNLSNCGRLLCSFSNCCSLPTNMFINLFYFFKLLKYTCKKKLGNNFYSESLVKQ